MFKCDYEKISGRHSGEWMNRLTSDTVVVAEGMTQMTPGITGMLIRLLGALILLIMMYPMFGYLILPVGLLLLGVNAVFRKILKKLHKQVQEADGNLRIFLQESLAGMLVIRVFGKEKQIVENANEKMAGHKKARMRRNHISNLCNSGFNGAMNVAYVVGTAVGGYGILTGTITYGTLMAMIQLIGQLQSPFASLTGFFPQYYGIADVLKALRSGQKSIYAAAGNTGFHPTLIVYDDESRGQVVGKFIAALDNNQLDNPAGIYKVIGAVKNKELKGLKISDYWAEFDDRGSNKKDYRYWSYIDAVAQACCEGRLFIAEQNIRKLLCKIFHYIGAKNKDTCKEFTVSSIKQTLDKEYFDVYRDALITLSTLEDFSRGSIDSLIQDLLQNLCEKKIEEILVALPAYFLEDKDAPIIDKDSNSFIEPLCGRRIQFDTIHGVKGETHDATLILETERSRSSDVKSIFTYFGVGNIQSSSNYNRKCLYVAMSRPRKLLCLAIQDKSYEASKDIFSNWKLIDCRKK